MEMFSFMKVNKVRIFGGGARDGGEPRGQHFMSVCNEPGALHKLPNLIEFSQ